MSSSPFPTTITISGPPCHYCGAYHSGVCSRVESMEYHPDGTLKRVTLRPTVLPEVEKFT